MIEPLLQSVKDCVFTVEIFYKTLRYKLVKHASTELETFKFVWSKYGWNLIVISFIILTSHSSERWFVCVCQEDKC